MIKRWVSSINIWILIIALLSLIYSAYRTDINQQNQTARNAGFELLKQLNQLQLLSDTQHFGKAKKNGFIYGWSNILMIDDLSIYLNDSIVNEAKTLHDIWEYNFEVIQTKDANEKISIQIKAMRTAIKKAILDLR